MRSIHLRRAATFIALACSTLLASAAPMTYDIRVDWTSGPLAGTQSSGDISWDSTLAVPNAGYSTLVGPNANFTPMTLLGFSFAIGAKSYGLADAAIPALIFDANGLPAVLLVGNHCDINQCVTSADDPDAFVLLYNVGQQPGFFLAYTGGADPSKGALAFTAANVTTVPEPAGLALAAIGLLVVYASGRRRPHR